MKGKETMKNKKLFGMLTLMSAFLALSGCTSASDDPVVEDLAYATIEINPGVAIMINAENKVRVAHALNGDGEMVLLELHLEGKTLDEAIEDVIDETVALDFVNPETENVDVDLDVSSNNQELMTQTRTQTETRINNVFDGHMIQATTQTRTYSQDELDEASAKDVTPLRLRLVKQAMIGNDDLLEEEALELDEKSLLNKVKQGATNMKQIAATLGADFLAERQAIMDEYLPQIHALQDAIDLAIANSEDTSELEIDLAELREAMVAEIQEVVSNYRQQTTQARQGWSDEAAIRKGGNSNSQTGSSRSESTTV